MFNFFKSKDNSLEFYAPVSGTLLNISEINDPVFSSKMLGDGYGVEPSTGAIYAPVYGTVTAVFPTKHAIGIQTKSGDDVLVHIGIDTVELAGEPFDIFVEVGDKVSPKKKIVQVDLDTLEKLNKPKTIIVVYTNRPTVDTFDSLNKREVITSEKLGELIK
jgi:PTS system glucose-specific IIA component